MKLSSLKRIRVVVSIVFFLLISALFLDFNNSLSPAYTNYFTFLQFIPSLIKFFRLAGITAIGFILVLILTALFGRVYCSSICPYGYIAGYIFLYLEKTSQEKIFPALKAFKPASLFIFIFIGNFLFIRQFIRN